tara:strand:+ start:196 stop:1506 length:1311 start_codon:yes stop_codon:yes gene_type:complete
MSNFWDDNFIPQMNHVYVNEDYKYDVDVRLVDGCGDDATDVRLEKSVDVLNEFKKLPFRSFAIVSPKSPPTSKENWIHLDGVLDYEDYGEFVLKYLHKFFEAKHCLLIQWDCQITNIEKWTKEFLEYDFVYTISDGYQKNTSEIIDDIGHFNGGLTIRSKKFCEATSDYFTNTRNKIGNIFYYNKDSGDVAKENEDLLIHRNYEYLKKYDLKFAPPNITSKFSLGNHTISVMEHRKKTAFGFHDMAMKLQVVGTKQGNRIVKYKNELNRAMKWLSDKDDTIFMGQSVKYSGNSIFGTLEDVDDNKRLELPVFEEVQMGMSIGMALNGYTPISCFPRMDFLLRGMDSLVNHLDKIQSMSNGIMKPRVIIRTAIGSLEPLNGGVQHTQNYIKELKSMLHEVNVVVLENTEDIFQEFMKAYSTDKSTILVEYGDYYNAK